MPSPTQEMLKGKTKTKAGSKSSEQQDVIQEVSSVVEGLGQKGALEFADKLVEAEGLNQFRLGGVLSVINVEGWYAAEGYETFREYVEARFGMKYRKAMYLIQIYDALVESGVAWAKVEHLGWSKLKELAGLLTPENVDEWVEIAEPKTVMELIEYIRSLASKEEPASGDESTPISTMSFKVHDDQKETIEAALDKSMKASGSEHKAVGLEMICLDFLGSTPKQGPTLKETLSQNGPDVIAGELNKTQTKKLLKAAFAKYPDLEPQAPEASSDGGSIKDQLAEMSLVEIMGIVDELYPDADITIEE